MSVSSASAPTTPPALLRDRLLEVADLLGAHPGGALMARLLATPPAGLRMIAAGRPAERAPEVHLALLALFAGVVRARLDDPDPDVVAIRLAAWRTWVATPSLVGPDGAERPLDRLADPVAVADAIRDLVRCPSTRVPASPVRTVAR